MVVELASLTVYPNGFTIDLLLLPDPHLPNQGMPFAPGFDPTRSLPRVGVRFSDGRTAGQDTTFPRRRPPAVDDDGLPSDPVLLWTGGGGGAGGFRFGVWVYPLPPPGELEIFVSMPGGDQPEAKVVLDGAAIRAAGARATVIWE